MAHQAPPPVRKRLAPTPLAPHEASYGGMLAGSPPPAMQQHRQQREPAGVAVAAAAQPSGQLAGRRLRADISDSYEVKYGEVSKA